MDKKLSGGKIFTGFVLLTILIGCATIMGKSTPEMLSIRSNPDKADVVIIDEKGIKIFKGKTPTTITLIKKSGYFTSKKYHVKVFKEAYTSQTTIVDMKLNGWYLGGNLIFGGLIGWLIIDPATGAMWTLDTNELEFNLAKSKQTQQKESFQMAVALLNDIPISLHYNMVRVLQ